MRLVYPPDPHQTYEASTFFIGSVDPDSTLTINGVEVPVSVQGFFAWKVSLASGDNAFILKEQLSNGEAMTETHTIRTQGAPNLSAIPAEPNALYPYVLPSEDIGLQPGETVILLCPAPQGAKVMCRIEWLMSRAMEMTRVETTVDNRAGIFGQLHQAQAPYPESNLFMAHIHVPVNTPPLPNLMVQFVIQNADQKLEFRALGSITILPMGKRPYALVSKPEAVTRTHPAKGARKAPLLEGTALEICGFWGESFKARYGPDEVAWVMREDIKLMDNALFPVQIPLHLIQTEVGARAFQIILPLPRLIPVDIVLEADRVCLRLFGAVSYCDVIHYQPAVLEQGLQQISWRQINAEVVEVEIALDSPLMGFQRYYDTAQKALVCAVRTARSTESFPYTVVIDPGHGGEENGSTAPDGTPEKDLNLLLALKLQQHLAQIPQLKVVLTRDKDVTLSLESRVKRAISAEANLLISLHHNALPDGRNPLEEQGVSTFYYHPFALPMARKFQEMLVKETGFLDYGLLYDSLHICRAMEMPALLLELGFLTHPEDAERCLDKQHQNKVVHAIALAVVSSLKISKP